MRTRQFRSLPLALAFGCVATFSSLAQSYGGGHHARALITGSIDETKLVTLGGNTAPAANVKNDLGPVPESMPMEHMQLILKRPVELEKELTTLIANQQDKSSPEYHHWLNATEFGERFGVAHEDIEKVTDWLGRHGFQVDSVFTNGMVIEFTGTAGQLKEAFHTEIHNLDVDGEHHIANMSDPRVPAALGGSIQGIYSLNDFKPHKMVKKRTNYTTGDANFPYLVSPADLATLYTLNPAFSAGYTGTGQTIVVVEDTNVYSTADWSTFRSVFGLTGYTNGTFTQESPAKPATGGATCTSPGVNADEDEAILDAQWASAAAPNAKIVLASCTGGRGAAAFGGLIAFENIENASAPYPQIMSMSYGECEPSDGAAGNLAFSTAFQQAATQGISVFVSSGDELAASCDGGNYSATHGVTVSGWMSSVYDVSVGGTDFADAYLAVEGDPAVPQSTYWSPTNTAAYGSLLSYLPETTWTDSCTSSLFDTINGTTASALCNVSGQSTAGVYDSYGGSGGPSNCATGTTTTSEVATAGCAGWPKPSWQVAPGVPADGVRDTPDLALMASNGQWGHYYPSCDSDPNFPNNFDSCSGAPDNWGGGGGTSFSSPIMAGIQALVNEANGETTGVGNPNSRYYALGALEYGTTAGEATCNSTLGAGIGSGCVFNDVTIGDISSACSGDYSKTTLTGTFDCYGSGGTKAAPVYGQSSLSDSALQLAYPTTPGWDFGTGLGSVNGYNLIKNWVLVQTSTAVSTPGSPLLGHPATFTATVTPSIGNTETGTVAWSSNTGCGITPISAGVATCTTSSLPFGSQSVTATYSGDTTYAVSGGSDSVIVKGTLTVTDNQSMNQGSAVPTLVPSYSGFQNGDTASVLSGAPTLSTTATSSSVAGTYPISVGVGTLTAADYVITAVNGTMSVVQAPLVTLTTSATITGSAGTGYTATVTVKNSGGTTAREIILTSAVLGSTSASSGVPSTPVATLAAGTSTQVTVHFAGTAGADGSASVIRLGGSYNGGTFSGSARVTLP